MRNELVINTTTKDHLGSQLTSIRVFLNQLETHIENGGRTLNFYKYRWSPPLLSVFFANIIERYTQIEPAKINSHGYFKYIHFPYGLQPLKNNNWKEVLNTYRSKSYIPLIRFPNNYTEEARGIREDIISHTGGLIKEISSLPVNYINGISYLLGELTDNIVEHSNANNGWISFQYYRQKGYLDICIGDSGMGLLSSYKNYSGTKDYSHINTPIDALKNAIKGESTKKRNTNERGYGIHTSRAILTKGFGGKFVMFSGNALLINDELMNFYCNYNGTIAFFRLPCKVNSSFSIYNFLE